MFFLHKPTLNRITLTCCVPVRASHTVFPGLLFPSRGTAPLRPMSAQSPRHGGFGVRRLAAAFTPECAATSSAGRVFESCRSFLGLSWQRCLTMYLRVGSDDQAPHTLFSSFCFCSRRFPKRAPLSRPAKARHPDRRPALFARRSGGNPPLPFLFSVSSVLSAISV